MRPTWREPGLPKVGLPEARQLARREKPEGSRPPIGLGLAAAAVTLGLVLAGHRLIPRTLGAGGLLESFLPWLGLAIPVLALAALQCRSRLAGLALILPTVIW